MGKVSLFVYQSKKYKKWIQTTICVFIQSIRVYLQLYKFLYVYENYVIRASIRVVILDILTIINNYIYYLIYINA